MEHHNIFLYWKAKETRELIFSWLSLLAVLLAGAYDDGDHNRNGAKFSFVGFLWLGAIDLIKCSQRTNIKEKSREQELIRTEVARKIAKESGRDLEKGGENGTEQIP